MFWGSTWMCVWCVCVCVCGRVVTMFYLIETGEYCTSRGGLVAFTFDMPLWLFSRKHSGCSAESTQNPLFSFYSFLFANGPRNLFHVNTKQLAHNHIMLKNTPITLLLNPWACGGWQKIACQPTQAEPQRWCDKDLGILRPLCHVSDRTTHPMWQLPTEITCQ